MSSFTSNSIVYWENYLDVRKNSTNRIDYLTLHWIKQFGIEEIIKNIVFIT